jgi:hypothetical protein
MVRASHRDRVDIFTNFYYRDHKWKGNVGLNVTRPVGPLRIGPFRPRKSLEEILRFLILQ